MIDTMSGVTRHMLELLKAFKNILESMQSFSISLEVMEKMSNEWAQQQIDSFNVSHPIGASVIYWLGAREGGGIQGVTRSRAFLLPCEGAVVYMEDCEHCISLSHIRKN